MQLLIIPISAFVVELPQGLSNNNNDQLVKEKLHKTSMHTNVGRIRDT